ncbi:hypothetical protein SUGI_0454770 [Cryptomeria japonica]|nr:hypothetical protein SUGI_0454770 [Cryptomeria japonica]
MAKPSCIEKTRKAENRRYVLFTAYEVAASWSEMEESLLQMNMEALAPEPRSCSSEAISVALHPKLVAMAASWLGFEPGCAGSAEGVGKVKSHAKILRVWIWWLPWGSLIKALHRS